MRWERKNAGEENRPRIIGRPIFALHSYSRARTHAPPQVDSRRPAGSATQRTHFSPVQPSCSPLSRRTIASRSPSIRRHRHRRTCTRRCGRDIALLRRSWRPQPCTLPRPRPLPPFRYYQYLLSLLSSLSLSLSISLFSAIEQPYLWLVVRATFFAGELHAAKQTNTSRANGTKVGVGREKSAITGRQTLHDGKEKSG